MSEDNPLTPMLEDFVGLNGRSNDVTVREETARKILPNDPLKAAMADLYGYVIDGQLKVKNTCALQGMAALVEYYGLTDVELTRPYLGRNTAVVDFRAVCKRHGVVDSGPKGVGPDELPEPGDFCWSGDHPREHISCIVDYIPETGTFITVDGGQGEGSETKRVERAILNYKNTLYLVSAHVPWVMYGKDEVPNGKPIREIMRMKNLRK